MDTVFIIRDFYFFVQLFNILNIKTKSYENRKKQNGFTDIRSALR